MAQPKLKLKDKVFSVDDCQIGVVRQIDNQCTIRYENSTELEYYIKWSNGAWTRHRISDIDLGYDPRFMPCSPAQEILYGKRNKRKTKANRGKV